MTFPIYIGAMIAAALFRNIGEYSGKFVIHMGEINDIGGISLSLFLGMAMITLKLWQLASLALPLIILLAVQAVLICVFARFVVFYVMEKIMTQRCLQPEPVDLEWARHRTPWQTCRCCVKICSVRKGVSDHSSDRKSVCRFYQQSGYYIFHQYIIIEETE